MISVHFFSLHKPKLKHDVANKQKILTYNKLNVIKNVM